jgi:hypothetical protein
MPVLDGADRMSASSLAQTLLLRLDLTSVSEGDCLLSDQPFDLILVSEGDCLLSNQASSIRNLHESSWLQIGLDLHCKSYLLSEPIIALVSEGDVLSTRVTIRNLSNSGSTFVNQLDAQDVHRNLISWHVLSGPAMVLQAESTALRLCEQTSRTTTANLVLFYELRIDTSTTAEQSTSKQLVSVPLGTQIHQLLVNQPLWNSSM